MGLGIFYCLKAFANGGVSLTGLEAVSDGISSFRAPVARNGRKALVTMCLILGFLVLGTSILAHLTHAVPYEAGTPTVVSQEVQLRARFHLGGTGAFLRCPGRHSADPLHRREHQLQRLPVPRELRRR